MDEGEGAVKPEALLIINIHVVDSAVERGNEDVLPGEIWFEISKGKPSSRDARENSRLNGKEDQKSAEAVVVRHGG